METWKEESEKRAALGECVREQEMLLLLRVRYSRYLAVASGRACAARAAGGWTAVIARAPGPILLRARFSLERALGLLAACGQRARV